MPKRNAEDTDHNTAPAETPVAPQLPTSGGHYTYDEQGRLVPYTAPSQE